MKGETIHIEETLLVPDKGHDWLVSRGVDPDQYVLECLLVLSTTAWLWGLYGITKE